MAKRQILETFRLGAIAGAAGGLAEVAWVALYAGVTGDDASVLAKGVTTAVGVNALLPNSPVAMGVAIHMTLAIMLGISLAFTWRALAANRANPVAPYAFAMMVLIVVWAVNFFVILPIVSPSFIHLVPYAVSLTSKLLFGLAAGSVIAWHDTVMRPHQQFAFARRKA